MTTQRIVVFLALSAFALMTWGCATPSSTEPSVEARAEAHKLQRRRALMQSDPRALSRAKRNNEPRDTVPPADPAPAPTTDVAAPTPPVAEAPAPATIAAPPDTPTTAPVSAVDMSVAPVQTIETAEAPTVDPERLVLGVYPLKEKRNKPAVVDGDTIRVKGLDASLRLLGIDTEETFKKKKERAAYAAGFKSYTRAMRGDSPFPAKYATPMGEEAAEWAREWFKGIREVRLEYDDLDRTKGVYGRHLVYVFAKKNGVWVNYNVEAVRAGMTPYFSKYGYSARFHNDFVQAQKEARAAKRGIWAGDRECYPDYDERLAWWTKRAESIQTFQTKYRGLPDTVELGIPADWEKLTKLNGQTATVFGTLGNSRLDKGAPYIMFMSHTRREKFAIVSQDKAALDALKLDEHEGYYLYVRGKVSLYNGRPQMFVEDVEKVWSE